MKPQALEKEKEKEKEKMKIKEKEEEKKDKKKKDSSVQEDTTTQKDRSKPSEEKKNKKKRSERSLSLTSEEQRVSKRRLLKIAKETFPSSNAEDKTSIIVAEPMNVTTPTAKPATRVSRSIERGIMIKEPLLQAQTKQQAEAEISDENEDPEYKRKGKKKLKKAPAVPSRDSTPSPLRRAKRKTVKNRLREEAWLQKQKNKVAVVGASARGTMSSSISLEVD